MVRSRSRWWRWKISRWSSVLNTIMGWPAYSMPRATVVRATLMAPLRLAVGGGGEHRDGRVRCRGGVDPAAGGAGGERGGAVEGLVGSLVELGPVVIEEPLQLLLGGGGGVQ